MFGQETSSVLQNIKYSHKGDKAPSTKFLNVLYDWETSQVSSLKRSLRRCEKLSKTWLMRFTRFCDFSTSVWNEYHLIGGERKRPCKSRFTYFKPRNYQRYQFYTVIEFRVVGETCLFSIYLLPSFHDFLKFTSGIAWKGSGFDYLSNLYFSSICPVCNECKCGKTIFNFTY